MISGETFLVVRERVDRQFSNESKLLALSSGGSSGQEDQEESGGPSPPSASSASASGSSSGSGSGSNERISSAGEENSESLGNSN